MYPGLNFYVMGIFDVLNKKNNSDSSNVAEIDLLKDEINNKDKEIKLLNEKIVSLGLLFEESENQVRKIESSVYNMNRINESLNSDLLKVILERDTLKHQIENSNQRLKNNKDIANKKECKEYVNSINSPILYHCKHFSIEIISIIRNEKSRCRFFCKDDKTCVYIDKKISPTKITCFSFTSILLIFENRSQDKIRLSHDKFEIIDSNGFSYDASSFCEDYSSMKDAKTNLVDVYGGSKCKYEFFIKEIEDLNISGIRYKENFDNEDENGFYIEIQKIEDNKNNEYEYYENKIKQLEEEKTNLIYKYEEEIKSMSSYNEKYNNFDNGMDSTYNDSGIKYHIKEDDEYLYIIYNDSNSDNTISFNREFDKTKGNYNWINNGDPLITLRYDNEPFYMQNKTMIQSSVSGVFEFDKNKLISNGEVICRIRKYSQEDKERVISDLERKDVKQILYKKEMKKKIERETLDELLSEGKIFNTYIKKDGNRDTISKDVANSVWNRDGGKCVICGSNENLEFDHIIPVSKGGATTFRNLQLLCQKCNRSKSDNIG